METNIQKWGNSLGVRFQKVLQIINLSRRGVALRVTETKTGIAIEVMKKKHKTLDEMLKDVTDENIHEAIDWGDPVGNEVW